MPFTLSHPAAVVPLSRRGLPFSALVIGCMAPDIPYFIMPSGQNEFSHSWQGLLTLSLPLGILALWFFHRVLKWPLLNLLPEVHRNRLAPVAREFRWNGWRGFILITLSVFLGILTHYVWDGLTHYYGWESIAQFAVSNNLTPFFDGYLSNLPDFHTATFATPLGQLFIFDILQYSSSLLGMAVLGFWYASWFRNAPEESDELSAPYADPFRKVGLTLIAVLFGGALIWNGLQGYLEGWPVSQPGWIQAFVRRATVSSLKFGLAGMLIYCLAWHQHSKRSHSLVA